MVQEWTHTPKEQGPETQLYMYMKNETYDWRGITDHWWIPITHGQGRITLRSLFDTIHKNRFQVDKGHKCENAFRKKPKWSLERKRFLKLDRIRSNHRVKDWYIQY